MNASSDNVIALGRLARLRPSDIASLRDLADEESGRTQILRALEAFLETTRASDPADWDSIFSLGAQMRTVMPARIALNGFHSDRPAAELLLAGYRGLSFDEACDAYEAAQNGAEAVAGSSFGEVGLRQAV